MPFRPPLSAVLAVAALAACAPGADDYEDPFTATGEVIALSGGDAMARGACITCHGVNGEGDGADTPRLAGLDPGYIQKQLEDYAADLRPDPVMSPIARRLSHADRARVAAYYGAMPPALADPLGADPALIAEGRTLYHQGLPGHRACAACHGTDGRGLGAGYPPVAGQTAAYTAHQLRQWKTAQRRNDPRDVMGAVSRPLSERQIDAVSAYAASLPHRSE